MAKDTPKSGGADRPLSLQEELFIREYLVDYNATQAAIRAGYTIPSAGMMGCTLLKKPKIKAKLQEVLENKADKLAVKADEIVELLRLIAFSDMGDYFHYDDAGEQRMRDLKDIPPEKRKAIKEVKVYKGVVTFKLEDRLRAIELLGKYLGMFVDSQAPANGNINDLIAHLKGKDD